MPYFWYTESVPTTGGIWRWSAITSTNNTTATYYPSGTATSSSPYTNHYTIPLSEYHRRLDIYDQQQRQLRRFEWAQQQNQLAQWRAANDAQALPPAQPLGQNRQPPAAPAVLRGVPPTRADHRQAADEVQARYEGVMREAAERTARVKAADDRARQLLLSHLTPEQAEQFNRHGGFIVIGESGIRYRVRCDRGVSGNVESLDGERAVMRYCAHMSVDLPSADHFLAQKFMLEHDEASFLRIANRVAAGG